MKDKNELVSNFKPTVSQDSDKISELGELYVSLKLVVALKITNIDIFVQSF